MHLSETRILSAKRKVGIIAVAILRDILILGLCFIILYPFFIKGVNAFKAPEDMLDSSVRFIPKHVTTENIRFVFKSMGYLTAFRNTFFVSFLSSVIQMAVCTVISYGFARFRFRGNGILFGCVLLTLIVPPQTILVPMYSQFSHFLGTRLSLIDSIWPVIILSLTGLGLRNGLYIFLLRQFFKNMPKVLEEAAYIDGYGPWATFFRIMLPSARSMMLTVFLFAFSWQWTDMFYSNLFFKRTPLLVNAIDTIFMPSNDPIVQSMYKNTGAMLAIIPLLILYIFTQQFFVQSVERSGIVG